MSELCLTHVDHRYAGADRDAVTGVDLVVPDGSMTAVVGPSGSGKSTLLRVAAGLERPTAGRVRVAGVDVTEHPVEQRDLTVMFQRPHLFDHLDVTGNVAFAPRLAGLGRRAARRRARHWLDLVHLPDADRRRVGSLSGGQQQRVALARALAAERGLLLLDEPFSALDAELRGRMQDLLCEVRAEVSPTVLLVTHDLDEAGLADRVVVLVDGCASRPSPTSCTGAPPTSPWRAWSAASPSCRARCAAGPTTPPGARCPSTPPPGSPTVPPRCCCVARRSRWVR